jgi:hypothetical protein
MLTVNWSPPLAKPRVPSSGSTQKKHAPFAGGFLADHGNVGREPGEAFLDQSLGALVGEGDGRAVELGLRIEAGCAHGHDLAPGGQREGDEGVELDGSRGSVAHGGG